MSNKIALAAFVAMPLVNAEEHEYDEDHYITTVAADETSTGTGTCTATPNVANEKVLDVVCSKLNVKYTKVDKAEGFKTTGRGYWFRLDVTLPTDSKKHISLDHTDSKVTLGNTSFRLNDEKVVNGGTTAYLWLKLDPTLVGSKKTVSLGTATFAFRDTKDGDGKTYTQELNLYVKYDNGSQVKVTNTASESGVYQIKVGEYVDGKVTDTIHTVEVPYVDGNETTKKVSEVVGNALDQYMKKAGYTFKGWFSKTGDAVVKTSYLNLAETAFTDNLEITAVFEKDPNYVAPADKPADKPSDTKPADKDKDSTPKTGNTDLMGFVPLMTLLSLVGIVTLKKTI